MPHMSLAMIVKNEESFLEGCLQSAQKVCDEIIIVDTGSTDNTINIAKKFTDKIYNFKWNNSFANARNFSIAKCTGKWILYLDADERLTNDSIICIKKLTNDIQNNTAYLCAVKSISTHGGQPNQMKYPRLFNNSNKISFSGRVHEQILPSLENNSYIIYDSDIIIEHFGYDTEESTIRLKAQRNISLLELEYSDNPNWYNAFQLAQTYNILGNEEKAVQFFNNALDYYDISKYYKAHCYRYLADYWLSKNHFDKAFDYIQKGLNIDTNQPLLNLVCCNYYKKTGNLQKSCEYWKQAYEINKKYINANCPKNFEIFIDEFKCLLFGIEISIDANDLNLLNYQLSELSRIDINTYNIFAIIFSGSSKLTSLDNLTEEILPAFLKIVGYQSNTTTKLDILRKIFDRFKDNSLYLNTLGNVLLENKTFTEAQYIFEQSFVIEKNLPTALYLLSAYINNKDIEGIDKIQNFINDSCPENVELLSKIKSIKTYIEQR